MHIFAHRQRITDRVLERIYRAGRRVGVLYAVALIERPAAAEGCEAVLRICSELVKDE